jgi:hypothetical protein
VVRIKAPRALDGNLILLWSIFARVKLVTSSTHPALRYFKAFNFRCSIINPNSVSYTSSILHHMINLMELPLRETLHIFNHVNFIFIFIFIFISKLFNLLRLRDDQNIHQGIISNQFETECYHFWSIAFSSASFFFKFQNPNSQFQVFIFWFNQGWWNGWRQIFCLKKTISEMSRF